MITTNDSDIGEHLPALFYHAVMANPRLIVELGTRSGESTRALLAAAAHTRICRVLSIDVANCAGAVTDPDLLPYWHFEQGDDVLFAALFPRWCLARGYAPQAEVIFLDTSHTFEHTSAELLAWLPHLAPVGVMLFHDTNCSVDIQRGVIRALEGLLESPFDEQHGFAAAGRGWTVLHSPHCNGLTVVARRALNGLS